MIPKEDMLKMHNQALVIYKENADLNDVMYPYQEIDKTIDEKLHDNRCRFIQIIPEKEIGLALNSIKRHLQKDKDKCLEMLQYRAEHSADEFNEKYGKYNNCFSLYKHYCDKLEEYEQVKDLPNDDPKQIRFILDRYGWSHDDWIELYIKSKGYGHLDNPYNLWDFYHIVNEYRFPKTTDFLVSQAGGTDNVMGLDDLDVDWTVENIENLTRVWYYIIFCKDDPSDSVVYTTDTISRKSMEDKFFKVEGFREILKYIKEQHAGENYVVSAIDFHY